MDVSVGLMATLVLPIPLCERVHAPDVLLWMDGVIKHLYAVFIVFQDLKERIITNKSKG